VVSGRTSTLWRMIGPKCLQLLRSPRPARKTANVGLGWLARVLAFFTCFRLTMAPLCRFRELIARLHHGVSLRLLPALWINGDIGCLCDSVVPKVSDS